MKKISNTVSNTGSAVTGIPEDMKPAVKTRLEKIFGPENVTDREHDLYPYSYDATESPPHMPDFVVLVENTKQVVDAVKLASEMKIPLVPFISGNNIGGLAIPEHGGIILDFGKKMNRILHVDENHMYALLEPGVTFGQLDQYLKKHHPSLRYCYPNAPPYSGVVGNALLSGLTNFTYHGSMGDWINGLEVVTHDGNVARLGTCFLGKECKPDNWFSRYPLPDLIGLFVNWQGMTGIVTKCAVQLWPRMPVEKPVFGIVPDYASTADVLREIGATGLADDVSAVSIEVVKMNIGVPEPKKFDFEPGFALLIPVSAHNNKHYQVKMEILQEVVNRLNQKHQNRIVIGDFVTFASIVHEDVLQFYNLPATIKSLVEYSGLTWVGTYSRLDQLEILMEEADKLFHEHGFSPFIYVKNMRGGHYGVFRPIIRYKKTEEDKAHALCSDLLDLALSYGCVPYKTPVWMAERMKEYIDPGWLKLFKHVKQCMDPNGIFNPGRWGI